LIVSPPLLRGDFLCKDKYGQQGKTTRLLTIDHQDVSQKVGKKSRYAAFSIEFKDGLKPD
tara:strand:+ start:95 stop:274 length:180 start_codon:yes stop_codon:yes gene_type:complete